MNGQSRGNTAAENGGMFAKIEILISVLLRTGVIASLAMVALGLVLMFIHHPEYLRSAMDLQRLTSPGAAFPSTLREVAAGLAAMRGQAVVVLGLLLLIATPIMRVAVSIAGFFLERDRVFTALTSAVLALLLLSFLLGQAG